MLAENLSFPFDYSGSHRLTFSAIGDQLTFYVDDEVLTATDSTFSEGRFGIRCNSFDNLYSNFLVVGTGLEEISSSDEYRILVKDKTLDVEVNKAIDDGLWWLYLSSSKGGTLYRWGNDKRGYNQTANSTASAVQAYEINGHLETGDPNEDPYVDVVKGGIKYLLENLTTYEMTAQTYGHPEDYNNDGQVNDEGNGIGLSVAGSNREIYELGAVMDALVASGTPDATARAAARM